MPVTLTMPQLGESVTEGTVTRWLKQVGDRVELDEDLVEISTDKVDSEIPSPAAGWIAEILVQEGETVPVGAELCRISEVEPASTGSAESPTPPAPPQVPPTPPVPPPVPPSPPVPPAPATTSESRLPTASAASDPNQGVPTKLHESAEDFESAVTEAVSDVESVERSRATFRMDAGEVQRALHAHPSEPRDRPPPLLEEQTLHAHVSEATEPPEPFDRQTLHAHPSHEPPPPPEAPRPTLVPDLDAEKVGDESPTAGSKPRARVTPEGEKRLSSGEVPEDLKYDGERRGILSPVVRRLADEYGVDLDRVIGTGTGGRITREDVISAASRAEEAPAAGTGGAVGSPVEAAGPDVYPAPPAEPASQPASALEPRRQPLTTMRTKIAEHMVESRQNAAHVFIAVEADFEAVEAIRDGAKESFKETEGFSLTYLPFIIFAASSALIEYPVVNSRIDMEAREAVLHDYVNMGIAVDLDGEGLIVPVIKRADQMTVRELARASHDLSTRAREKRLTPDDVSGGTFTITNPGPFGSFISVPIINYPEVAILAVEGVETRAVVVDGEIAARRRGNLGLSWDHRAFDGATAARFLNAVKDRLERWDWGSLFG